MNLLIESFEGGIYLAYQIIGEQKQLIKDDHQHPMKFLSVNQARDHFSDQGVASAMLVHNSAYDEMCGEHCGNTQPFEIDLKWSWINFKSIAIKIERLATMQAFLIGVTFPHPT